MTTIEFFTTGYAWLMEDWTHLIVAAAFFTALTPTPKPGTLAAKIYKVVDVLAVNVLHAKSTGVTPAALAEQVVAQLALQQKSQSAVSTQEVTK
jgi:hypothetical protein